MKFPDDLNSAFDNKSARARTARERKRLKVGGILGGALGGAALLGAGLYAFGDKLLLGPDAREIAREEAGYMIDHIGRECRLGLKSVLNDRAVSPDADSMSATIRYTLDAYSEEEEVCVTSAVSSYQDSMIRTGDCTIAASYPSGWTEKDGGMRMAIAVDCLPHFTE